MPLRASRWIVMAGKGPGQGSAGSGIGGHGASPQPLQAGVQALRGELPWVAPSRRGRGEPEKGANAFRLTSTQLNVFAQVVSVFAQVEGSPFDARRLGQTH